MTYHNDDHDDDDDNDDDDNLVNNKGKQVAQGQYVVSDTRCPALSDCEFE